MRVDFEAVPMSELVKMAETLADKLEKSLGCQGVMLFDNEVEMLVHLLRAYIEMEREEPND